jgi:hypothetical protein
LREDQLVNFEAVDRQGCETLHWDVVSRTQVLGRSSVHR